MPIYNTILNITCFVGIFLGRSKEGDVLLTKNMVPGVSVYKEKLVTIEVSWKQIYLMLFNFYVNLFSLLGSVSTEITLSLFPFY